MWRGTAICAPPPSPAAAAAATLAAMVAVLLLLPPPSSPAAAAAASWLISSVSMSASPSQRSVCLWSTSRLHVTTQDNKGRHKTAAPVAAAGAFSPTAVTAEVAGIPATSSQFSAACSHAQQPSFPSYLPPTIHPALTWCGWPQSSAAAACHPLATGSSTLPCPPCHLHPPASRRCCHCCHAASRHRHRHHYWCWVLLLWQ